MAVSWGSQSLQVNGDGRLRQIPVEVQPGKREAPLTKLEIGIVGADVIASAKEPLHHQGRAHGIEEAKVFGDPTFLLRREKGRER